MAIVHALLLSMLIAAMAAGAATGAHVELRIADHHRDTREAAYAARAAVAVTMQELRDRPDWGPVLTGDARAAFTAEVPPGSSAVCCGASSLTARLRTATGRPWTAFGWSRVAPLLSGAESPLFVVVWIVDDPADADGDPFADSNGTIGIRAEARTEAGLCVAVEAIVERPSTAASAVYSARSGAEGVTASATAVRLLSWREPVESP